MVEREVLIAKIGDLQGHVKMTCLMMNSVYCPPGTFPQPTVSLPHAVLSVLQLSKLHSPLPFFLCTFHSPFSYLPEYFQSMQLSQSPGLVAQAVAVEVVMARHEVDFAFQDE
jgi:hypothetical protein